jgi:hypothetical protein
MSDHSIHEHGTDLNLDDAGFASSVAYAELVTKFALVFGRTVGAWLWIASPRTFDEALKKLWRKIRGT